MPSAIFALSPSKPGLPVKNGSMSTACAGEIEPEGGMTEPCDFHEVILVSAASDGAQAAPDHVSQEQNAKWGF